MHEENKKLKNVKKKTTKESEPFIGIKYCPKLLNTKQYELIRDCCKKLRESGLKISYEFIIVA